MKKLISLFIAAVIVICSLAPLSALADEPYKMENPLYSNNGQKLNAGAFNPAQNSASKTRSGKVYSTLGRQLYNYTKGFLERRQENFYIYYLSSYKLGNKLSVTQDVLYYAFLGATDDENSTSYTDGDYLRWAVSSWSVDSLNYQTKKDGYYYYNLNVTFEYFDTAKEEEEVDKVINSYLNSYNANGKSDDQIVRDAHDFICKKATYDYSYGQNDMSSFSPYGTLVKGKCVCQGYAAAFYRLLRELGYSARFVSSDANEGKHAWNIVQLDGKYYIVDCTWDDQAWDKVVTTGFDKYAYFLVDYETSKKYDNVREHTLYSAYYGTSYFYNNYRSKFASKNYYPDSSPRLSDCKVSIASTKYTYYGGTLTPNVSVNDAGYQLKEGRDYSVSYNSNINTGSAEVVIKGLGRYSSTSTSRRFIITPTTSTGIYAYSVSNNSAKLSWNPAPGYVTGYVVEKYSSGKWKYACTSYTNSCTVNGLDSATKQAIRVIPFKAVSKRYFYGWSTSSATVYTKPDKTKIKKTKSKSKKLTVKWKKVKCTGYQIQYSRKKNMKGAKTVKTKGAKKTSRTIKKLKKNKKYYVRVRAYKKYKINGKTKTVYGKWSSKKSIKIK